jgi:diacylglycerol kinase (ATP)
VTPRFKWYLRSLAFPLVALKVYFRGGLPDLRLITGQTIYVGQLAVIANGHYYGEPLR